nr:hypothetical protein [uncultured Campylobacter sp.]
MRSKILKFSGRVSGAAAFVLVYGQILHIYSIEFHPNSANFIPQYGKI